MPLDEKDLEYAVRFQQLFVEPLVDAVRAELKPLAERAKQHEEADQQRFADVNNRLNAIEGNQKKALFAYAAIVAAVTAAVSAGWAWLKSKLHWS